MAEGLALQPLLEIGDKSAVGYEVMLRPSDETHFGIADFERALGLVPVVNPASMFIGATEALLDELGETLPQRCAAMGVLPNELVWMFATAPKHSSSVQLERAYWLKSLGFGVGVEGVEVSTLADPFLSELLPSFVVIDETVTCRIGSEARARAEASALMSYFGRLGVRTIVRGVDNEEIAHLLLEAGFQLGIGQHLSPPVVLDTSIAAKGDAVVNRSWFREQAVRVLGRFEAERTPITYGELPEKGPEADDKEFAIVLGEAARLLQAEHDQRRILEIVSELLPRVVPVDRLAIFQADWDSYTLRPKVVAGEGMEGLSGVDDLMGTGITGWAFLRGEPYNCGDTFNHAEAAHIPGSKGGRYDESLLVIPLVAGDHRLGVLDLWRDGQDRFSDEDVERCAIFGYLAAAAWRSAQLYTELEQRVVTDKLTGLLNKRWWDELAPREAAQAIRTGSTLALLLVDLDHFKRINDSCGHAAGDIALRNAARVLAATVRSGDAAVRFGGDEFLLVLHNADARGAERVAESVRKQLSELAPISEAVGNITASIGVALFPAQGESLEDVVHEADLAMYRAKAKGRDQVVVFLSD
ncbi:MAG TPA: diguanylate cyclase [Acidimicrobiales bacterium]|nr:diguanylate cyclase [Acidimicrobiales bacterium]